MKIHDPATNDIEIPTPDGWPDINVSGFQEDFSIDDKVPAAKIRTLMIMAVDQVISHVDPLQVVLPLTAVQQGYFRQAIYQQTFSLLLPTLPVNNQHKSEPVDLSDLKRRIEFYERLSLLNQQEIPGFIKKFLKPAFDSELL